MSREDRIKAVREGVEQGMSSTQIAAAIGGCTRNAVIGLSHRARIPLVATPASVARVKADKQFKQREREAKEAGKPKPVRKEPRDHLRITTPTMKKVVEAPPVLEFPDEHYRAHLESVVSGQCRWPLWGDELRPARESLFYCGKPVKSGSPYCYWCHKKGFAGFPSERKKDPPDRQRRGQLA